MPLHLAQFLLSIQGSTAVTHPVLYVLVSVHGLNGTDVRSLCLETPCRCLSVLLSPYCNVRSLCDETGRRSRRGGGAPRIKWCEAYRPPPHKCQNFYTIDRFFHITSLAYGTHGFGQCLGVHCRPLQLRPPPSTSEGNRACQETACHMLHANMGYGTEGVHGYHLGSDQPHNTS